MLSVIFNFIIFLSVSFYLEGVCAAKHLMKSAIVITNPMPINKTAYQ